MSSGKAEETLTWLFTVFSSDHGSSDASNDEVESYKWAFIQTQDVTEHNYSLYVTASKIEAF